MTEYTLELEYEAARPKSRRALVARLVNVAALVLLLAWSWKWLPPMAVGVLTQTDVGRNGLSQVPGAHQWFEVLFVAAHWGVRWLPGALVLGAISQIARRVARRATA